ncbi:hypothetical protein R1sor_023937 [Riccia sorocarpa]|uniref:Uncharacterized protein n=1 Tax=Riccia sorocarpa TaxID=122646 RepID=A0ABD3GT47_9MARC
MTERRRVRTGFRSDAGEEEVICPKPRRVTNVSCPAPDFLKPSRRRRSHTSQSRAEGEAGFEILDIFLSRSGYGDSSNFGCSPPYYCGSPPSRSGNPLIHDVQFTHIQRIPPAPSVLSSLSSQQKKSSCGPVYGGNPSVRVEGFASSAESRCSVPALA